jgi:U4/U6.U5 tri-snRNP-associated protein 2
MWNLHLLNYDCNDDVCCYIIQAFSHVPPLRNYFLSEANYAAALKKRPPGDVMFLLVQRFGELLRKLWNPCHFKAHVSPHEMLQAVVLCSKKKFQITQQGEGQGHACWFKTWKGSGLVLVLELRPRLEFITS